MEQFKARIESYEKQLNTCQSMESSSVENDAIVSKSIGKVRDVYLSANRVVLVSTDRQSAFDRLLAVIPCKGQVLTQTSVWWFNETKHIVPNHLIASPNPCVVIAEPFYWNKVN